MSFHKNIIGFTKVCVYNSHIIKLLFYTMDAWSSLLYLHIYTKSGTLLLHYGSNNGYSKVEQYSVKRFLAILFLS